MGAKLVSIMKHLHFVTYSVRCIFPLSITFGYFRPFDKPRTIFFNPNSFFRSA